MNWNDGDERLALGAEVLRLEGLVSDPKEIFTWGDLNHVLGTHRLGAPRLRVVGNGVSVATVSEWRPSSGQSVPVLNPVALHAALRSGATLVLDGLEEFDTGARDLARYLASRVGSAVQANAFASFGDQESFGLHRDDHDGLVLQLEGRKYWQVAGNSFDESKSADWEGYLEAGDALYIPRGVWHTAISRGEPSLHITFGFERPTLAGLVAWSHSAMRSELRGAATETVQAADLSSLDLRALLNDYVAEKRREHWERPSVNLPHAVTGSLPDDAVLRQSSGWIEHLDSTRLRLSHGIGDALHFDRREDIDSITWCFAQPGFTVLELVERFGAETARSVLRPLIDGGYVRPVDVA